MSGETRMLERRVSNNRADLNSDQQMNYFLAWFREWSDLQKADFVPILAAKVGPESQKQGVISVEMNGMSVNKKPLSLFQCQLKLFKDWANSWNDDKKEYLLLRLKDLDAGFYDKYEEFGSLENSKPKDYFEPGVPPELVRASRKNSSNNSSPNVSINGNNHTTEETNDSIESNEKSIESIENNTESNDDGEDSDTTQQNGTSSSSEPLSTIQEDE